MDTGLGMDPGTGTDTGIGMGTDMETDVGLRMDPGTGTDAGKGTEMGLGTDTGMDPGEGKDTGLGRGTEKVWIYTDGAARGNPEGPGGYGTILQYVDRKGVLHEKTLSAGYVRTTNNRMELMAAIAGLEALNRPCEVELYSDSRYLTDAFNRGWIDGWVRNGWKRGRNEPVKNPDLWKRLLAAKARHRVTFIWVRGHAGHPQNERCDRLATSAADGENLLTDEGLFAEGKV